MPETMPTSTAASKPKQWQDYTPAMKARITVQGIALGVAQLLLIIWAVRDLRRRSADEINGNKKIWMLAACAPPVGPIAYFVFGRKRGMTAGGAHAIDT